MLEVIVKPLDFKYRRKVKSQNLITLSKLNNKRSNIIQSTPNLNKTERDQLNTLFQQISYLTHNNSRASYVRKIKRNLALG